MAQDEQNPNPAPEPIAQPAPAPIVGPKKYQFLSPTAQLVTGIVLLAAATIVTADYAHSLWDWLWVKKPAMCFRSSFMPGACGEWRYCNKNDADNVRFGYTCNRG